MIFSHLWVILGPLGVLQSHEKAKNRKKSYKLAVKSISQGICKWAMGSWVCSMQDRTWWYDIKSSLGSFRTPGGVAEPWKGQKIATDFTNWLSSQYLKEDASEPLTRAFVSNRTGHSAINFGYRWVLLEPLGVLQSHEKAKNRHRFYKLAVKSISQRRCKRAIKSWVCLKQDGT